jgi:hypothetical protein
MIDDYRKTIAFALIRAPDFATFYAYDSISGSQSYHLEIEGLADAKLLPKLVKKKIK